MPKGSKKKRIKVLRGILAHVRFELMKDVPLGERHTFEGVHLSDVARIIVRRQAKRFADLTKRMDDLEEAFSTIEDADPIRQLLLKELGEGSGSEAREGMNTLELVELLAKKYRRSERASRDWQNHAAGQAEQLTKIKIELLSVSSRPDERLTPLEVADTVAESVRLLREMLEQARSVVEPSELAAARNTIKDLNRVNSIVRAKIAEVIPTAGLNGYLPVLVGSLVDGYKLRGKLFLAQRESFKSSKASLAARVKELHVCDVDVLDEAHRLVGAAGDESLSNQDLIAGLIAIVHSLKEEPSRDQSPQPAVRPADSDSADPDPTAVPG